MGKSMFCDVCRKTVAIEEALSEIVIGGKVVAEVCLTCGSQLETEIKKQIADNEAALIEAQKTTSAPAPPPPSPKPQAPQPAPKPAEKPAGPGAV